MRDKHNITWQEGNAPDWDSHPDRGCEWATSEYQLRWKDKLKELLLMIKQAFQFLDTLGFSKQDKDMFSIRQALEVNRTIIILNAVEMMDNPILRQWLAIRFLPDEDMFSDVSLRISPRVLMLGDINISSVILSFSTFPVMMLLTPLYPREESSFLAEIFSCTRSTTSGFFGDNFPAINANLWRIPLSPQLPLELMGTSSTPESIIGTRLTAINAGMFMSFEPMSLLDIHSNIVASPNLDVNYLLSQIGSACLSCPFEECYFILSKETQKLFKQTHQERLGIKSVS